MDHSQRLRIVFEAIRDGRLDPSLAADLATEWAPSLPSTFWDQIVAQGLIPGETPAATKPAIPDPEAATVTAHEPVETRPAASAMSDSTASFKGEFAIRDELDETSDGPEDRTRRSSGIPPGRYEPIRLHRSGGLGQVWLAKDTVLGREVAMKVVRPDRVGVSDYVSRFVREARVTGRLEHPGIVPLYDLIEADHSDGSGACYVMRFVSGATLAEAISAYHARRKSGADGPLELRTLLDALIAVSQAVAFAHSRGVLHRDLKGQNVVLGDFGEVFLLDWGLNKGTEDAKVADPAMAFGEHGDESGSNGIAGTPAYMAPEVAAGKPSTRASDIYGLGAILYSILTGKAPATGPTPEAILKKVQSEDPPAPRAVNPATSASLEAICRKSMTREPAGRYPSAEMFASELRNWLADEPVSAYPDSWPTRVGRWAKRHRTAVSAAAALLVTAVIGLSIGGLLLIREQKKTEAAAKKATDEWQRAETNLDAAQELTIRLIQVTEKILPPVRGSELARRDLASAAVETIELFASQRPDSVAVRRWSAQLHRYQANLFRLLDQTTQAEPAYQAALKILRSDTKNPDRLAETLRDHAGLLARTGRLKEALASLDEAMTVVEEIRKIDPNRVAFQRIDASVSVDLGGGRTVIENHDEAIWSADRAIDLLTKLSEVRPDQANPYDPLLLAAAVSAKAAIERRRSGYERAAPIIKDARDRALALVKAGGSGANLDDVLFTQALIEYEASQNWLLSTKEDLKSRVEKNLVSIIVRLSDLAKRHAEIPLYQGWLARTRLALGQVLASEGRLDEALASFEIARIELDRLISARPTITSHRADLGRVHLEIARLASVRGVVTTAEKSRALAREALKAAALMAPDDVAIRASLTEAQADGPR